MKVYAVEYVNGGFSDGFTLAEVQKEITDERIKKAYGGVKRYFAIAESQKAYNKMMNIKPKQK